MSTPEAIKAASQHLRGTIAAELAAEDPAFGHDSIVLLKFHGIYQQDDRDQRRARAAKRLPLDYSCMVRAAIPGGLITPAQWAALDQIADLADGSLRLTTRQGVQFHVVTKGALHGLVHGINAAALTTLAACGDVVRNTMACPAPLPDGRQAVLRPALAEIVARFLPRTTSYWEIWVDGEKAVTAEPAASPVAAASQAPVQVEPVYGDVYLPRKFKIGFAWPGDNCVDVYTQDVGIVPTLSEGTTGELTGWNVLVGGGLGMSHAREDDTYPRLASPLAWVGATELTEVVEAIITVQRDFGNRTDRARARLKYLIDERGLDWFRDEVASRLGRSLHAPVELLPWTAMDDHHGWFATDAGDWALGVPVPSGRVRDGAEGNFRSAFATLMASGLVREMRVTPRQDVILTGIAAANRVEIETTLRSNNIALAEDITPFARLSIACPALPTCGQALGEAERKLGDMVVGIGSAMDAAGVGAAPIHMNVTGCPNGCARPYTAEIGIVGRGKTTYDVYLGGAASGERLGERVRADVGLGDLSALLAPVFSSYGTDALVGETFGDFCHRLGTDAIVTLLPIPTVRRRSKQVEESSA
jgi:sulfite reductase (ferredoxin)